MQLEVASYASGRNVYKSLGEQPSAVGSCLDVGMLFVFCAWSWSGGGNENEH